MDNSIHRMKRRWEKKECEKRFESFQLRGEGGECLCLAWGQKHNTHLYSSSQARLRSHKYGGRLTEADLLYRVLPIVKTFPDIFTKTSLRWRGCLKTYWLLTRKEYMRLKYPEFIWQAWQISLHANWTFAMPLRYLTELVEFSIVIRAHWPVLRELPVQTPSRYQSAFLVLFLRLHNSIEGFCDLNQLPCSRNPRLSFGRVLPRRRAEQLLKTRRRKKKNRCLSSSFHFKALRWPLKSRRANTWAQQIDDNPICV